MLHPTLSVLLSLSIGGALAASNTLNVTIPDVVAAGQPTTVTFSTDADPSVLNQIVQVFLYSSVSNQLVCNFTQSFNMSIANSITIPPSVGPAGAYYRLSLIPSPFFTPGLNWPFSYPGYTNPFFLEGGNASFSPYEVPDPSAPQGRPYFAQYAFNAGAEVPCAAYNCARGCSALEVPDRAAWANASSPWRECLAGCPGVSVIPESVSSIATATDFDPPAASASGSVSGSGTPAPAPASPLATPTGGPCEAADLDTPCAKQCCPSGQYCQLWKNCVDADWTASVSFTIGSLPAGAAPTQTAKSGGGARLAFGRVELLGIGGLVAVLGVFGSL